MIAANHPDLGDLAAYGWSVTAEPVGVWGGGGQCGTEANQARPKGRRRPSRTVRIGVSHTELPDPGDDRRGRGEWPIQMYEADSRENRNSREVHWFLNVAPRSQGDLPGTGAGTGAGLRGDSQNPPTPRYEGAKGVLWRSWGAGFVGL